MILGAEREGSLERQAGVRAGPQWQAGRVPPWPDLALLAPCLVWLDYCTGEAGHLAYSVTPWARLHWGRLPRDSTAHTYPRGGGHQLQALGTEGGRWLAGDSLEGPT